MSENLPNIDDLFRKALDEHDERPSADIWANLDKNLDKKKVAFISKKYRKLQWAAAALLIFSAGMAMYTLRTKIRSKELAQQNAMSRKNPANTENAAVNVQRAPGRFFDSTAAMARSAKMKEDSATGTAKMPADQKSADSGMQDRKKADPAKPTTAEKDLAVGSNAQVVTPDKQGAVTQPDKMEIVEKQSKTADSVISRNATALNEAAIVAESEMKFKREIDVATIARREKEFSYVAPPQTIIGPTLQIFEAASQASAVKPFRGNKFSATIFYSADFVSANVSNDRRVFREDDKNEIKNKEEISQSSRQGVLVNYEIGKRWSIQSGLAFSSLTTDIMPKTIFARPDRRGGVSYRFNCSAGYSYVTLRSGNGPAAGDSLVALSSKNSLHYLVFPIAFTYSLPLGRFNFQPGAGIAKNFLTSSKIETVIVGSSGNEKSTLTKIEGLNSSYTDGSISLAANYYFTKNLALNVTPVARFALGAINRDAPVKTYFNSISLAGGLTFNF